MRREDEVLQHQTCIVCCIDVKALMDEDEEFDGGAEELVVSPPLRIPRTSIAAFDSNPFVKFLSYTFGTGLEFRDIRSY
jgi:hypothetical protein